MRSKLKVLKVFVALTFALLATIFGILGVALAKAIVPIFQLTSGTWFEVYVQDPILYVLGPLFCGYTAFRKVMDEITNERVLKSTALGVVAGIVTTIVGTFAIPFRNFEGGLRLLLVLAQFPLIPFVVGYIVYRFTMKIYLSRGEVLANLPKQGDTDACKSIRNAASLVERGQDDLLDADQAEALFKEGKEHWLQCRAAEAATYFKPAAELGHA